MSQASLEDFALKSLDHGRLTGVSLALHAIPDAFLLLHCGVGCKHKATSQLSTHDRAGGVVQREGWTEVGDAELIEGSAHRVGPYLRSWYARQSPGVMVVCSVTFLDLSGEDLAHEVQEAEATIGCQVLDVKAPGHDGDLWAGFASTVLEICRRMDFETAPTARRTVAVIGHLFSRYEGDETGNLAHVEELVTGLGGSLGPVLLSGQPYEALGAAPTADTLVVTPYMAPVRKRLARILAEKKKRRAVVDLDLPMGLAGTRVWLTGLAEAMGTSAAEIIDKWEPVVSAEVTKAAQILSGKRVAIFADVPLAAGWLSICSEVGMTPVLVGLRGHSLGGRDALSGALERMGAALDAQVEVLEHPSIALVRERVQARPLDLVLGASTELNALAWLDRDRPLRGLEIGFPCRDHHVEKQ